MVVHSDSDAMHTGGYQADRTHPPMPAFFSRPYSGDKGRTCVMNGRRWRSRLHVQRHPIPTASAS